MRRSTRSPHPLRTALTFAAVGLYGVGLAGCHASELEPQTPDEVWQVDRGAPEAAYTMAPVPAVYNPAPIAERPRSISLGFIGDAPLSPAAPHGAHWPYVQEDFHYRGYASGGGYGRPHGYARGAATYAYGYRR